MWHAKLWKRWSVLVLLSAPWLSGCSLVTSRPTIWRSNSSPCVERLPGEGEDDWESIRAFEVGGIGDQDSLYNDNLVAVGYERPIGDRTKVGGRAGLLFLENYATIKGFETETGNLTGVVQLHSGVNFSDGPAVATADASLLFGKVLRVQPGSAEEAGPSSVIYIGARSGWVGNLGEGKLNRDYGSSFTSMFLGFEIWPSKWGLFFTLEKVRPDHPDRAGWDRTTSSCLLVSSGIKWMSR